MKKTAFTLAEVLLVLGIIGVITAVTIPAVTSSNQNKKFTALTRKAQSTIQSAIDNKMGYTLSRPSNGELVAWLIAGSDFNQDAIKFIERSGETITTPDGMVYYASGTGADGRLKYEGAVYVDLNGAEGPTETTVDDGKNLVNASVNDANFDVIAFDVTEDGDVQVTNTKARQYLGLED